MINLSFFICFRVAPSFYFFNNSTITVLPLESKQLEPLVQGPYGNFNFTMNG